MTIAFVLAILVIAGILFCFERIPVDMVALGVMVALLLGKVLTIEEVLKGLSSEPVIVIAGLFVLTAGLRSSGAMDLLVDGVKRLGGGNTRRTLSILLLVVAAVSGFMNNTTCTAVFLPVGLALAKTSGIPPSRVLMPLAFASILGGTITLIGTSTNVIVSGLLPHYGQKALGMFELSPIGVPLAILGLVYLIFLSERLLPSRGEAELGEQYHIGDFLTELVVLPTSPLVGQSLAEAGLGQRYDLNLLAVERSGSWTTPEPEDRLEAGDQLLVEGKVETLLRLGETAGLAIRRGPGEPLRAALPGGDENKLVEALVLPRSKLVGRTLKEIGFRQRFGAGVVALNRHGEAVMEKLARIPLQVGDVLLVFGPEDELERLPSDANVLVLNQHTSRSYRPRGAFLAPFIFFLSLVLGSTGLVPLGGAILIGSFLLLLSRSLTPQEAYQSIDWRMLVLIAGMMAYATALTKTGGAALLAEGLNSLLGDVGPLALLAGFYLLTVVLTQPMSNQAAALVVLPVAMGVAAEAGINPRAMAMTITFAASSSFLTPLEPSCLLVYGPGRYRFLDYPRLGAGLTLLGLLLTLALVPWLWPLTP
ncbi:MAG TPA: SLC13 family permease [Thermoanaerobaculia bacterium]|nr:SLC13 family permease [Thermoanaerobaculia bacterium]